MFFPVFFCFKQFNHEKHTIKASILGLTLAFTACTEEKTTFVDFNNFSLDGSIAFEGEGVAEISAYDKTQNSICYKCRR